MFKIPKQNYTVEFKREAVRQVEIEGKSPTQVARDLRDCRADAVNWRRAAQERQAGRG